MKHPSGLPARPTPTELARVSWLKATASNGGTGCVEVAHLESWTVVRDSKNPDGPVNCYTRTNGPASSTGHVPRSSIGLGHHAQDERPLLLTRTIDASSKEHSRERY